MFWGKTSFQTAWQGSEYAFAASMSVSEYMLKVRYTDTEFVLKSFQRN